MVKVRPTYLENILEASTLGDDDEGRRLRSWRIARFAGAFLACGACGFAFGHDDAEDTHLRCQSDVANTTLTCIYARHQVTARPGRPSREGYADIGRYQFSCLGGEDTRTFHTTICRAGTGGLGYFHCWTRDRLEERRRVFPFSELEGVTESYVFTGRPIQETLMKFLTDPSVAGRSHFLANDGVTREEIASYQATCGLQTEGGLSLDDIANLLPILLALAWR